MWLMGVRMGLATMVREPILGLKRILLPASYWRSVEFRYVWDQLDGARHQRLFDLGSPKDLSSFFAGQAGREVVATDILDAAIEISDRYAVAQRISGKGPGMVLSEVQDGRRLGYDDGSFDAVFSVSVLEHIPDDGDTLAIVELVRIVKPGGLVVVTVPYDLSYRETFVDDDVYERSAEDDEPVFYERHYDADALRSRLMSVPGTDLVDLELWGERFLSMERILSRLGVLRVPLSPLEALLARIFLTRSVDGSPRPRAAFFTLKKAE
jgi:SAM-dependent methyltransferase